MSKRSSTDYIFVHCSATPPSMDIGVKEIRRWHKNRGWADVGYHFIIRRNGHISIGRPLDAVGAHVVGYNSKSVGVCLIGGINKQKEPEKNFTKEQMDALTVTVGFLKMMYPTAELMGHNEVSNKACPSFDVKQWWKDTIDG
jgi:N-acetylmuramoyl-L-alanine amidase